MVEVWLPYGSSEIPVRVPEERLQGILLPGTRNTELDISVEVNRALKSSNLTDLAKKAGQVCIAFGISSNKQLLADVAKLLIDEVIANGVSPNSITLLRTVDSPDQEIVGLPGMIVAHDPNTSPATSPGGLQTQFPVALNSTFVDADLKIVLGELKPHHFFGLSGLPDIVLPGLASADTVRMHFSDRKGKSPLDLYAERVKVANSIPNLLSLSYVSDANLSPARIAFGTVSDCLDALSGVVQEVYSRSIRKAADIVVMGAGGAPLDMSLNRAIESLPAALAASKRDGALIVAAECTSGHGGGEFYDWCVAHKEPRYLEMRLRHAFNYEGFKAAFLQRTLQTRRIYLV